jgi:hypothetical protein
MKKGKLLSHIILVGDIKIDPKRVDTIQKIEIPRNKKYIQYFIGRIIFLRRFVPNVAEIIKPITKTLKKDVVIKWSHEEKSTFQRIKHTLVESPVLVNLDYAK